MAKLTVDQMIDRLPPDRQEVVFAKAQHITQARERARFESLDDVLERLPEDRRASIEKDADRLTLAMEASRLKSKDAAN